MIQVLVEFSKGNTSHVQGILNINMACILVTLISEFDDY
jgi:hypothetical protein